MPVDWYDATPWHGVTEYCPYEPSGQAIAVVQAMRTSRNPREGEKQLRHYVDAIIKRWALRPFGFMTNDLLNCFWDMGEARPRLVAGMFSQTDLTRFRFLRENAVPLAEVPINDSIAG